MRDSGTRTTVAGDDEYVDDEPDDDEAVDELPDESESDESADEDVDTSHLDGVEDGCGCAEVWEHLSDERDD